MAVPRPESVRRHGTLVVVLAAVVLTVVASYFSKAPCFGPPYDEQGSSANFENRHRLVCYSDVQMLWLGRGIVTKTFPYVDAHRDAADGPPGAMLDGAYEYPVLTGLFIWVTSLPAHDEGQYVAWTTLALAPFGLLAGFLLALLARRRALIFAAAPAMVFYTSYNWDLLVVGLTVAAVFAWQRRRPGLCAVLLGLGAAAKIYPGFLLLPLTIERLVARDVRGAIRVAVLGAGSWLAVNLPFTVINFDGWWATYAFQGSRTADLTTNSVYFWGFPDLSPTTVNVLSITLIAVSWAGIVALGWFSRTAPSQYPWLQVGAAMLCAFLLFNKVYSPQYFLWVQPFLVLVRVRWGWWVAYWIIDAVLFLGINRLFHDSGHLASQAAVLGVWTKSVILLLLMVAFVRAPLVFTRQAARTGQAARAGQAALTGQSGAPETGRRCTLLGEGSGSPVRRGAAPSCRARRLSSADPATGREGWRWSRVHRSW
ncbi:MAG: DUF2029 domain-containing protein [Actinomycetales bacterium]|nr:DUF2029 domain-containing protein [Actinomycetales bacterium]